MTQWDGVLTLMGILLLSGVIDAERRRGRQPRDEVNIRGSEDIRLNCPSIPITFPEGTLRCESCLAVGEALTFLVGRRSMHPVDAQEDVCEQLLDHAQLRQATSGLRYWDLSEFRNDDEEEHETMPFLSNPDKAVPKGARQPIVSDKGEAADPFVVTYHTDEERVVLPCAAHGLKRFCESFLETNDEVIEDCLTQFQRRIKDGAVEDELLLARPNRAPPERGGKKLNRDVALEALRHCLTVPMCEVHTPHCHSRLLAIKEREEMELFRKYQGAYGAATFPYVGDRDDRKLYERNPFAHGGERVAENDLLKRPFEDREL